MEEVKALTSVSSVRCKPDLFIDINESLFLAIFNNAKVDSSSNV